jgi:HK97 family phage major capsid protein
MTTITNSPTARGITSGRLIKCLALAGGDPQGALAVLAGQGVIDRDVELVLRSMVDPVSLGDFTVGNIVSNVGADFSALLRQMTIIGRLTGIRRVPFDVRLTAQLSGGRAAWGREGTPAPAIDAGFATTLPLELLKVSAIAVLTKELVRLAKPSTEPLIAGDVAASLVEAMDTAFIDPASAGVPAAMPRSVTYGAPSFESSGSTPSAIDADWKLMLGVLLAANMTLASAVWIMSPVTAVSLSLMRDAGGSLAYPNMTARGGNLLGLPVLTSNACGASGSPGERFIALVEASEIALADDGAADLSYSANASVQMNDAPSTGPQALLSLWQNSLVGILASRFVNWTVRRPGAVAVLRSVTF